VLHLQIGPSQLALGHLVPSTLAAGFDVCIIGKPGDRSPRKYGVAGSGPKGRLRYHTVQWFVGPDSLDDLPADLLSRIRSAEPALITCTLRDKIAARRPFIEELLAARKGGDETILLACENAPDRIYKEIAAACEAQRVTVLQTVVNRMCIARDRDSKGRRIVSAHELGEWLIERPEGPSALLGSLTIAEGVELVDDIEARHDRKLWMVNGAHQALALMGHEGRTGDLRLAEYEPDYGADDLRRYAQDPQVIALLTELHEAMDDVLGWKHPQLTGNLDYGKKHVIAYGEHDDSVDRVLGAFRRLNLAAFIGTLELRLAVPARICFREGRSVAPFDFVFDVFESLVENLDAFQDCGKIREDPDTFDPRVDEGAIAAYFRLVRGWHTDEQSEERVARFAEALALSRP
jgi:hypothetical protein